MRIHRAAPLLLWACAAEADIPAFDQSAGFAEIEVLGDGFVSIAGRRRPLEAVVLELRQRSRAMSADQRARFVVRLRVASAAANDSQRAAVAEIGMNRLVDELMIMGIRQVVYL